MARTHPAFRLLNRQTGPGGAAWHLRHVSGAEVVLDDRPLAPPFAALSLRTPSDDDSGAAHVLEHMIFRGARAHPVGDLYAELMRAGPVTDLNASTLAERTTFHLTATSDEGRAEALAVLAEAIFEPLLHPGDLEEERCVVSNEMLGHWSDPARAALDGLRPLLFPGTAQTRAYAGLPAALARLTLSDLADFHQTRYRLDQTQILLGLWQQDPQAALDGLHDMLVALPPAQATAPSLTPAAPFTPPIELPPDQSVLTLGWRLPVGGGLVGAVLLDLLQGPGSPFPPDRTLHLTLVRSASDAPQPDLRLVFAPTTAAAAAQAASCIDETLAAAMPGLARRMADACEGMAGNLVEEAPLSRLDRLAGPWSQGQDPLSVLDTSEELARLRRIAADPDQAEPFLRQVLNPAARQFAIFAADPSPGAAGQSHSAPLRLRDQTLTFRTPRPVVPELPRMSGESRELRCISAVDALSHRLLALPLAGLAIADLPLAAGLARGLALATGAVLQPVVGPKGAWLLLRWAMPAPDAIRFDGRLAALLTGQAPATAPLPAPLPLHLRITDQLQAQLSGDGALLAALAEVRPAAEAADCERIWLGLTLGEGARLLTSGPVAGPVLPVCPQGSAACASVHRPKRAAGPDVVPIPGTLGTIGLALRLPDTPALALIAHALEWHWLRDTVRQAGGAYGVRCRAGPAETLVFLSARDPDPDASFQRFAESPDWLARHLQGAVLQRVKDGCLHKVARVLMPGEALALALTERLTGGPTRAGVFQAVVELDDAGVTAIAGRLQGAMAGAQRLAYRSTRL